MALGYDTYEDNREFEQGEVKRYATTKMKFPCYVLVSSEEKPVKMHSIKALQKMSLKDQTYSESVSESMIYIYYCQDGQTAQIGQILPNQVKTFLKLFSSCNVEGYLSENEKLDGMYLYILAEG